jgi:rhomboid family protein
MGIYDRDYVNSNRGMGHPPSGGGSPIFARAPGWTMTTWIIVINIAVHILAILVVPNRALYNIGNLNVYDAFQRLEVWRLITFQFLHDDRSIMHLLFNMFGMWVFGPMVERYLGRKKYLAYYLVCGLAGGILFTILTVVGALPNGVHSQLIGASAGVFGVIVACAYVSPNSVIQLLFPPIPLKMRTFAYGYVGIALFSLLSGSQNAGGQAAHVGGAIAGYFFIRKSHLLTDFFDILGDSRSSKSGSKPRSKKPRKAQHGAAYRSASTPSGPSQSEIDKILDKVSQKGLASLSEKEKRTLAEASKK